MLAAPHWSLTRRQRVAVRLVVGTLLVLTPVWFAVLPITPADTTYRYRTVGVTADDGGIRATTYEDLNDLAEDGIDGIACSGTLNVGEWTRVCVFEFALRESESGSVTAPITTDTTPRPPFVKLGGGDYYRRNTTRTDAGMGLSLDREDARTVLAEVAVPRSELPLAGRWAVRFGSVATDGPRTFGGRLVDTGDGYELIYLYSVRRPDAGDEVLELVLWILGIGTGVHLLRRGYREIEP